MCDHRQISFFFFFFVNFIFRQQQQQQLTANNKDRRWSFLLMNDICSVDRSIFSLSLTLWYYSKVKLLNYFFFNEWIMLFGERKKERREKMTINQKRKKNWLALFLVDDENGIRRIVVVYLNHQLNFVCHYERSVIHRDRWLYFEF